jgi:hypothetical protein
MNGLLVTAKDESSRRSICKLRSTHLDLGLNYSWKRLTMLCQCSDDSQFQSTTKLYTTRYNVQLKLMTLEKRDDPIFSTTDAFRKVSLPTPSPHGP